MTDVTREELQCLVDFAGHEAMVRQAVGHALSDPRRRVRFLGRYASWNGFFGSGVAALAGKVGRSRGLFLDPEQPVHALADRSVYVASFFFDAARDEFDDHESVHRDTHRCLAQSTLSGLVDYEVTRGATDLGDPATLNALLDDPPWLRELNAKVADGYGARSADELAPIFSAIGYHLGSELLADAEFSIIDQTLREQAGDLVEHLLTTRVAIAGQEHVAYHWIPIHSGHGGGAEADHFEWATQGARLAFRFVSPTQHAALRRQMHEGFEAFARDHRRFFTRVNASDD
ncbi:MAG TPA: hypothetical protein PKO41_09725 [Dokdonella sp.]|uniref:hypothetical protein n=1 Tax=Dokdonella sp. TaxID=2291710 RepID=UPI0025C4A527|nr:hypothetical protein [Dokdonella sp.]MBX3692181.1 hypothetical protein [Dokdonella sp.]HNR92691.1 hypothetical protein [Dokdonella sp.]